MVVLPYVFDAPLFSMSNGYRHGCIVAAHAVSTAIRPMRGGYTAETRPPRAAAAVKRLS
jgi:hypothetical protein